MSDADYFAKMKSKCVITESGCWEMQSFRRVPRGMEHRGPQYGYGLMYFRGKNWTTHRLSWTLTHGPIPKGMIIMHTCDNPPCCNPEHLRLGTYKENSQDASRKGRSDRQWQTHCKRGHKFTPENTRYARPERKSGRVCLACTRLRTRLADGWTEEEALNTPHIRPGTETKRRVFANLGRGKKRAA